jgi:hypothetical protein
MAVGLNVKCPNANPKPLRKEISSLIAAGQPLSAIFNTYGKLAFDKASDAVLATADGKLSTQ